MAEPLELQSAVDAELGERGEDEEDEEAVPRGGAGRARAGYERVQEAALTRGPGGTHPMTGTMATRTAAAVAMMEVHQDAMVLRGVGRG